MPTDLPSHLSISLSGYLSKCTVTFHGVVHAPVAAEAAAPESWAAARSKSTPTGRCQRRGAPFASNHIGFSCRLADTEGAKCFLTCNKKENRLNGPSATNETFMKLEIRTYPDTDLVGADGDVGLPGEHEVEGRRRRQRLHLKWGQSERGRHPPVPNGPQDVAVVRHVVGLVPEVLFEGCMTERWYLDGKRITC